VPPLTSFVPWRRRKEQDERLRPSPRAWTRDAGAPKPAGAYVPAKISRGLIFALGQTPTVEGKNVYEGKVGSEVNEEDAYAAARLAALNCVAELHNVLGDLGRIRQIVKVTGYVASAPGFGQQPRVVNGASELFQELWGALLQRFTCTTISRRCAKSAISVRRSSSRSPKLRPGESRGYPSQIRKMPPHLYHHHSHIPI
jgi:enamine deaminase RidA (YjgF/YER057c/UK114 family)